VGEINAFGIKGKGEPEMVNRKSIQERQKMGNIEMIKLFKNEQSELLFTIYPSLFTTNKAEPCL